VKITEWLDRKLGYPARKVEPPTLTCGCPAQVSAHYVCVECGNKRCEQHRLDPHHCETTYDRVDRERAEAKGAPGA
jgi:hypothetical protein